jgi:hypothetical protein
MTHCARTALLSMLLAACGGSPAAEPVGEESSIVTNVEEPASGAEAAPEAGCTSDADCEDGEMCTGPEGCDVPWTCQPLRPCTRDLRPYCSCDGRTVRGSGTCPPEPYRHPGPC